MIIMGEFDDCRHRYLCTYATSIRRGTYLHVPRHRPGHGATHQAGGVQATTYSPATVVVAGPWLAWPLFLIGRAWQPWSATISMERLPLAGGPNQNSLVQMAKLERSSQISETIRKCP